MYAHSQSVLSGEVKTAAIEKTPVELVDNTIPAQPKKTILVPETSQKVLLLTPSGLLADQNSSKVYPKAGADQSELVIPHQKKCKKRHTLKNKIIPLGYIPMT